ncbi:TBC1 domain family member 13-like [Xenia sp. Carnegie-2017]|uniref:TBC1 domain family member 13-like n=1 Tax=Xenia sp. Carnegie-2017 TaxID=2897299 RepID=UPI001F048E2D|nr:TBC1 domain family member 13-like [Xenia sp. Carnegie-2017]
MEVYRKRIDKFQAICFGEKDIDFEQFRFLCFHGISDEKGVRSLCWKVLLNYLPTEKSKWSAFLQKQRNNYEQYVNEFIVEPFKGKDISKADDVIDHPLNPNPSSYWSVYFKENEILFQIDKDCRRLLPDISFFQIPTEYPKKELIGDDKDFPTLRKRVQTTYLEANHVKTNRMGIKIVAKRRQNDEYAILLDEDQEAHWEVVERILFIYAKLNPGTSYVQGMNEIIGPLYYIFASDPDDKWREFAEPDSFYCFMHLMSEIRDFFIKTLDESAVGIGSSMRELMNVLRDRDFDLWKSLDDQELEPQFYSFRWITVLLSQEFPLPDVIRLWDSLFADPQRFQFLMYVCCAMLMVIRDQLLEGDFAKSMRLVQNYPLTDIHVVLNKAKELHDPFKMLP